MAQISDETTTTVLSLQRRLLAIIDQSTATGFIILEQYGETETTITVLEQLQNARERAETYYSRFYNSPAKDCRISTACHCCYGRFISSFN